MDLATIILALNVLLLCSSSAYAQRVGPALAATPTPAPAPEPTREYVNLTYLLTVAGQYHTFLNNLISTNTLKTFQDQANNTDEGITIFVPDDAAFNNQKQPSLASLKPDQHKSLTLFHAIPKFYSLANFKNFSLPTLAGQQYSLNFTNEQGTIHISTGWTNTRISSSVHSTPNVAIYQIKNVLLPEEIFGTDIPPTSAPTPAPAHAPENNLPADAPSENARAASSPESSATSSPSASNGATSLNFCSYLVLLASGIVLYL